MRLPYSNVCRAFPELDRFTDEQCAEYVRQVRKRFRRSRRAYLAARWMLTPLIAAGAFVLAILATFSIFDIRTLRYFSDWTLLLLALALASIAALPSMLFFFASDHVWLRRRIRRHMEQIKCPQCSYAMLGLSIHDGVMRCPECGERVDLRLLGLTAADVMGVEAPA